MPTNEILAPSYLLVKYHTSTLRNHVFRLYFDAVPADTGINGWRFSTYTDPSHLTGWLVSEIVVELCNRMMAATLLFPRIFVDSVEVWSTVLGANVFLGIDSGNYSGLSATGGSVVASAYTMFVFKAANRDQFRLTIMDAPDSRPQRYVPVTPPAIDNLTVEWFMLKSAVEFVTNDDLDLALAASFNTGYNRKLARTYGRQLAP